MLALPRQARRTAGKPSGRLSRYSIGGAAEDDPKTEDCRDFTGKEMAEAVSWVNCVLLRLLEEDAGEERRLEGLFESVWAFGCWSVTSGWRLSSVV